MASSSKNHIPHGLTPASGSQPTEAAGIFSLDKGSSIPSPSSNPVGPPLPPSEHPPPPAASKPPPPPGDQQQAPGATNAHHRFLTPTEWARVAHGIGAIREGGEEHEVVHPTCWYWPPKGLPEGLYRDAVVQRTKYAAGFVLLSALHWLLLVLQVTVGAVLTALGSLPRREAMPITILAAVNTVSAGLLALLHNSGLPDRYRMDRAEFVEVEEFLREVLDTGIVEAQQTAEDVLDDCYARLARARATVLANKPDVYTSSSPNGKSKAVFCPDPNLHVPARSQ